ncbi:hypothetical protein FSP39_000238 [Pinctada imbricata]|uniref:Solute carrier organic anion transporter family member n=1 Tax=Pinctada imbricata TaxID=66713 RepID=A0AA88XQW5_PINIB|nr:hypothetical protein FSP39_000238 [Pinctada imbricata]
MVVNGFVNVVISNIERRYGLTSTETGTVASCYDIASVLCLIPISYFGGLGCKPRYLGIGVFIMGVGSLVFALPHFTSGSYDYGGENDGLLCDVSVNGTETCTSGPNLQNYRFVFFLGQLLHGAGATPLYTLGVTYLDENLPLRSSSMYIGIFYAFAIVGPAIGYLAGGAFLDIYVDFNSVDSSSVKITPDSPRWVGAWWVGFLITAALAFIVAFPLGGFPTSLPGSSQYRQEREKEVYKRKTEETPKETEQKGIKSKLLMIWNSVKVLLTNPTFMFLNLAAACEGNILAGFATFTPKFIEAQFSLQSSMAAQFVGYAAIPAGGGGTFLGGYLVKKFNLRVRGIIRLCLGVTIPCVFFCLVFLVHCDNVPFAGVNIKYGEHPSNATLRFLGEFETSRCNNDCDCAVDNYMPVCGIDNVMYYSPCHAGCRISDTQKDPEVYNNCSCVTHDTNVKQEYMATEGKCKGACNLLPLFMPIFALVMLCTFTASMPALSATLRCVPQQERSFALGIQWIIARCLGSIPGPILFGKIIDLTCLLWQKKCTEDGSCFFYDNKQMSYNLLAVSLCGKTLSSVFFLLALLLYKQSSSDTDSVEKSPADDKNTNKLSIKNNTNSVDTLTTSVNDEIFMTNSRGDVNDNRPNPLVKNNVNSDLDSKNNYSESKYITDDGEYVTEM